MDTLKHTIIVLAAGAWGRGATLSAAIKAAGNPTRYVAYFAHVDTRVTDLGGLEYTEFQPVEIERKPIVKHSVSKCAACGDHGYVVKLSKSGPRGGAANMCRTCAGSRWSEVA